jgi:hypothetical protein
MNKWKVATFVLAGALAVALGAVAYASAASDAFHVEAAREGCKTAEKHLAQLENDKAGNRPKALAAVEECMKWTEAMLKK